MDAVGFEAHGHGKQSDTEAPATVLNSLMTITRAAGGIGIPGLYVTEDPGAEDTAAQHGNLSMRFGLGWAKSHRLYTGQTPVLRYNRQLMQAILHDRLPIAKIVNATVITLDDAPKGQGFRKARRRSLCRPARHGEESGDAFSTPTSPRQAHYLEARAGLKRGDVRRHDD